MPTTIDMTDMPTPDDAKPLGPCTVSFIGFEFETPEGRTKRLILNVTVGNGDYQGIIDAVKEKGGWPVFDEDEGEPALWFLPWPCAAVRILPVEK